MDLPRNYQQMELSLRTRNKTMRLGTWNIKTLSSPGAVDIVDAELDRYRMDIVALQETRWPDNGKTIAKNFVFYYSGTHDGTHYGGVGFAVNKRLQDNIINFEAIDERLCKLRVKGKFKNISIICIYAPTLLANDDDKDTFYEKLEEKWNNLPSYDIKLIMGDANAQIGKEDVWREVAGRESLHDDTNNNGYRLLSMAAAGNIKIVSTTFPRKNIHKGTWVSPGGSYTNQIDHVLIDSRHKRSVTNVRSIRGAECGTDHYLVLVHFQQRIQCNKRNPSNKRKLLALEQLKEDDKYQDFQLKLENRLQNVHQEDNNNLDQKWNSMKTAIQETLKEVCDTRKSNNKKPWFDSECKKLIQKRKEIKKQWLSNPTHDLKQRYNNKSKEVTRTLRRKKREWINGTIQKAEEDRTVHNSRDFYRTIRFFKKGYAPKTYGVKNTNGEVVMQTEEVLETWKTYFKDLLNCNNEISSEESQIIFQNVQPEVQSPSLEEVENAIKILKNNKAPGEDGITAEVLKAGGNVTAKEIHKLILEVWEKEDLPQEWTEALIIPIHKKGDKLNCRGISLLNNTYKIFSKIVQKRLEV
uniref:Craniofacial development protein 2 n=1 Tax=Cacopsylla melanoneura TaxID=428564 RepID=A0A8D8RW96_9HEMI